MENYLLMTEEQRELVTTLRGILKKELEPTVAEYDEKGEYPMHVHKILCDAGFNAIAIPEQYGGLGLDQVTCALLNEEMGKVDAGFGCSFSFASGGIKTVLLAGTEEQKQYYADRILIGGISCTCITKADAGSDVAAVRTTAVKDGDDYILNGTKTFISNGPIADTFTVLAVTDKEKGTHGMSIFIVEKERGVKVGKKENKMGIRLSPTSEVVLEDVRVPAKNMVGPEGEGFKIFMRSLGRSRPLVMSIGVGIAQRALDLATDYAKTRKTFGKPIIENQGVSFLLADMEIQIQAARNLVLYAARCMDVGADITSASACAKAFASDTAMKVTTDAVQVFGGYGYSREYPVEKLMRDAKIFSIFEGTNQIQRVILSGYLKKQH